MGEKPMGRAAADTDLDDTTAALEDDDEATAMKGAPPLKAAAAMKAADPPKGGVAGGAGVNTTRSNIKSSSVGGPMGAGVTGEPIPGIDIKLGKNPN